MPRLVIASLLFVAALTHASTAQTPTWKAEFVGANQPGWSGVFAEAVNDTGMVIGNTTVELVLRPWYGTPGTGLKLLPLPDGTTYARANEVNNAGLIVGQVLLDGIGSRAAIWQPGPGGYTVTTLPQGADGQFPFDARAVNDRGDVVGKYGVIFGSYAWKAATGTTELETFPDYPEAINNRRQILGDTYRMDLDTLVLEDLGDPVGTGFNYLFSDLTVINDAGECGGYGNVATGSSWSKQAVRFTDGVGWKAFNAQPLISANVMGISAAGDTAFQLGIYGLYVYVDGVGSIGLQSTLDPVSAHWDLSDAFAPRISRCGVLATNGADTVTGDAGIVVLTPHSFDDRGGASMGALGDPVLGGFGTLVPGAATRLRLSSAAPNSIAYIAVSTTSTPIPLLGGMFHPNPAFAFIALPTDALGRLDITFNWPAAPVGSSLFLQAAVLDPESLYGKSLSNAIEAVTK